ncbi:MAG: TldD/PmbA family protein [Ignisphaera sp.]|uniref:TldD/PmbA family protein n=1 Tax=Ignisphaera aggregans TaxID=334771 RepID=A0A832ABQ1_9CREN
MEIDVHDLSVELTEKALREGFDEAIAIVTKRSTVMTKLANSEISVIQRWNTLGIDLYLAKDRRIIILSLEPSRAEDIDKSIKDLLSIAPKILESQLYAPLPQLESIEPLNVVDTLVIEAMDRIDDIAEQVIEVSHRERIDSVAGMIQLNYTERSLSSSKGASATERKTSTTTYVRAFSGQGSGQWCHTSTKLDLNNIREVALIASRFAVDSRNKREIEPDRYDIILSPMVFGNLLNYIVDMASAFSVMMGASIFMNRAIGDKVASENLTIHDVPRDIELPGATGFDDEAMKTFNKPVIEKGKLKTLLHNTKTATIMKARSTGNAGWIQPRPWSIAVKSGDATVDEMIANVHKGLVITNNWYTRLQNYVEGTFSTIARDAIFLIENNRVVGAVNKIRIADNLNNLLSNIDMIGRDLYSMQWWEIGTPVRAPYVLVRNIRTSKHFI